MVMTVGSFFIISMSLEAKLLDVTRLVRAKRSIWSWIWWAERSGERMTVAPPMLHMASWVRVEREEGGRRRPMSICCE